MADIVNSSLQGFVERSTLFLNSNPFKLLEPLDCNLLCLPQIRSNEALNCAGIFRVVVPSSSRVSKQRKRKWILRMLLGLTRPTAIREHIYPTLNWFRLSKLGEVSSLLIKICGDCSAVNEQSRGGGGTSGAVLLSQPPPERLLLRSLCSPSGNCGECACMEDKSMFSKEVATFKHVDTLKHESMFVESRWCLWRKAMDVPR